MSELLNIQYDLASARRFNESHAKRYWPDIQMHPDLVHEYPGLSMACGSVEFAQSTHALQSKLFDDATEFDGKFGAGTWAATIDHYAGEPTDGPVIIRNGVSISVDCETPLLTWHDEGGLDLHRDGGWSKRPKAKAPDLIVLHWGGRNAKSCRNALASRDLSSHFGTDRGAIYQWLDISHNAWHAGRRANGRSIGIDICQQPTVNLAGWYNDRGYDLEPMENPSMRGPDMVLPLHPETIKATADLLRVLTKASGIPLTFPRRDDVLSLADFQRFSGVLGHHHISAKKWDVAPWIGALKEELGV